jgi:hypothetical protein
MGRKRGRGGSPAGRSGRTGRDLRAGSLADPSRETCPLCGRPVRRAADIVDELVQVVIDEGGSIEHVRADTALKEYLVAASLRFALPPEPER